MLNILIPTDFSENAHAAARYAVRLFGSKANYTLVNAYDMPHTGTGMLISMQDIMRQDAEKSLKEVKDRLVSECLDQSGHISAKAELGHPDIVLRKLVKGGGYDLIVMGTKGATGLKSILVGSVASQVIQEVSCPVIAVSESTASNVPPKKVLFAVDEATLDTGGKSGSLDFLNADGNMDVMVLHVISDSEERRVSKTVPQTIKALEGIRHTVHSVEGEDVGEAIVNFAKANTVDMIAMVRRKKNLFANLFGQSNTRDMIQQSAIPLLVIPSMD